MFDDKTREALQSDAPNEPEALPLQGVRGAHSRITETERRERREYLSYLLASGRSRDGIFQAMLRKFGTKKEPVQRLIREIYSDWAEEDAERKPFLKNAARKRLYRHIEAAANAGSWTAIANLEKVLASIEGTAEPIEISTPATTRLSEALVQVLNETDPAEVRKMIDSEKQLVELGKETIKALPEKTNSK